MYRYNGCKHRWIIRQIVIIDLVIKKKQHPSLYVYIIKIKSYFLVVSFNILYIMNFQKVKPPPATARRS